MTWKVNGARVLLVILAIGFVAMWVGGLYFIVRDGPKEYRETVTALTPPEPPPAAFDSFAASHPMPRRCDYKVAPVGDKLCHYELHAHWYAPDGFSWDRINEQ